MISKNDQFPVGHEHGSWEVIDYKYGSRGGVKYIVQCQVCEKSVREVSHGRLTGGRFPDRCGECSGVYMPTPDEIRERARRVRAGLPVS